MAKGKFVESKHRRGYGGKFANKAGAGKPAPKRYYAPGGKTYVTKPPAKSVKGQKAARPVPSRGSYVVKNKDGSMTQITGKQARSIARRDAQVAYKRQGAAAKGALAGAGTGLLIGGPPGVGVGAFAGAAIGLAVGARKYRYTK